MKLIRTAYAVALALLLVVAAIAQEKQQPNQANGVPSGVAPLLVIESFTHDFGEVKAGTPLRYAFIVKNQGKADLLINNVSPG
jgi:hypothetical protein